MTTPTIDLEALHLAKVQHDQREARRRPDGTLGPVPIEDRLWRSTQIAGDCWEFTGTRSDDGYGSIRHNGRMEKAHRVAYQLTHGSVPADLKVMHSCDNPPCINPAHLAIGTVADNNRDRHVKGRTVVPSNGPDFWRAKTRCPQGHPYDGDNLRLRADGRRRCAACYRSRAAAARAAKKGGRS